VLVFANRSNVSGTVTVFAIPETEIPPFEQADARPVDSGALLAKIQRAHQSENDGAAGALDCREGLLGTRAVVLFRG